jgi:hypothetical protein
MAAAPERWDIFCKVVDNYGDAGVAWRLARQLAAEHGKMVRLWLGELDVLAKLRPDIDPARDTQAVEGVEVLRWRTKFSPLEVADVVVETFGCDPPEDYVLAMAQAKPRPRWINLEYLSAEKWVEGSHALPSPHPRLPLVKHYFFPGFTRRTGGLLRERGLLERRDAYQAALPKRARLRASVFAYPNAPLDDLLKAFDATVPPVEPWVPGVTSPFVAQDRYDEVLWSCDVNFVRGEDSFVRAQWAARPFVWHIYPQEQGAHWVKLSAFLALYTEGLERADAAAITGLWEAWNRGDGVAPAWRNYLARLEPLRSHARDWAKRLATRDDLTAAIVDFADNVL